MDTRIKEITKTPMRKVSASCNKIADKSTPKIGVVKPNTATFDTGLYFKRTPQSEYATADTIAR